eukprot:2754095-Rhodomonas_salina.7
MRLYATDVGTMPRDFMRFHALSACTICLHSQQAWRNRVRAICWASSHTGRASEVHNGSTGVNNVRRSHRRRFHLDQDLKGRLKLPAPEVVFQQMLIRVRAQSEIEGCHRC